MSASRFDILFPPSKYLSRANFRPVSQAGARSGIDNYNSRLMVRRLLLVLLVITASLTALRGRELFVGDETKYGQVVREMRTTGEVFLPTLQGTPFTHKPPVHFWLIDALTYPFGLYSIWAFVLPSL